MTAALPRYRARFVHVTAVWAYGVTQPVLAFVDGNPDLVLFSGISRRDLLLFAALVALAVPVIVVAYCWFVGRLSRWAGDVLYLVALGVCLAPLAARAVKLVEPGLMLALVLVALASFGAVLAYARLRAVRLFVGYSVALPLIAVAAFSYGLPSLTEDAEAAPAPIEVRSKTPVVVIVLDEMPAASLMTPAGNLDRVRYPGFGRLARDGTWYPNATTVHEWTTDAVPALVTGRVVTGGLPTARRFPRSLFSVLGDSYTMHVHESKTRLCPERYCGRSSRPTTDLVHDLAIDATRLLIPRLLPDAFASRLAQVDDDIDLRDEAVQSVEACLSSLEASTTNPAGNVLVYCHLLLPHAPWSFLPSGAQYDSEGFDGWLPDETWESEPWLVLQGYQRHLLQVGYVDRLLADVFRRLDRAGLYDRALVVVTADHGAAFHAGVSRRETTEMSLPDIANVPLFVKYPRQRAGRVDPRPARTIDILPTIAAVLETSLPWDVDGRSLLGRAPDGRDVFIRQRRGKTVHAPLKRLTRQRSALLSAKADHFGTGRQSLYLIGTNRDLLGRRPTSLLSHKTTVQATIQNADDLAAVQRATGFLPVRIFGRVRSGSISADTELAIAVNGRIEALTRAFTHDGEQLFRALVPESTLHNGANRVEVFVVRGAGRRLSLAPIAST